MTPTKVLFINLAIMSISITITITSACYAGSDQVKCPPARHLVWQMQDSAPDCEGRKDRGFYLSSRPLAGDYGWVVLGPITASDCDEAHIIAYNAIHNITESHTVYMAKYTPYQYGCTYKPYAVPREGGMAVYWGD